jgi:hypothetical protein
MFSDDRPPVVARTVPCMHEAGLPFASSMAGDDRRMINGKGLTMASARTRSAGIGAALAVLVLAAAGQATASPLSESVASAIRGEAVILARDKSPHLIKRNILSYAVGAKGLAAMALAAGPDHSRPALDDDLEDPAPWVGHALIETMVAQYGAISAPGSEVLVESHDPGDLSAAYPGVPYVLDVFTTTWKVTPDAFAWSHYGVIYRIRAKLVDTRSRKVVVEAFCFRHGVEQGAEPTEEEMIANKAAVLNQVLHAHAAKCLGEFREKLFGLKN